MGKDSKKVLDERSNFIRLALFLLIDVLKVTDGIHDLFQAGFKLVFRVLEDGKQFRDFIEGTFTFDAISGVLEDLFLFRIAQQDMTGSGRGHQGLLQVKRSVVSKICSQ